MMNTNMMKNQRQKIFSNSVKSCQQCSLLKEIFDIATMKQIQVLLSAFEKKIQGSNIATLFQEYIGAESAIQLYKTIPFHEKCSELEAKTIAKNRIKQFFSLYFPTITNKHILEISIHFGHYLPFITHCSKTIPDFNSPL